MADNNSNLVTRKLAIKSKEATLLADLTGIVRDLTRVIDASRSIQFRQGPGNAHLRKACFDSAVMRYRRCFNTGKRSKLERDLASSLNEDESELHERVLRLADKSVAHCVDGSEENITYVNVVTGPDRKFQAHISVHSGVILHHEKVGPARLEQLARKVRELAQLEAQAAAEVVIQQFVGMSDEEQWALPELKRLITDDGEMIFEKYGGSGARRLNDK